MTFISVKKQLPKDDQTVLGINENVKMLPVKCYYDSQVGEFFCLETFPEVPLSLTHYSELPKLNIE